VEVHLEQLRPSRHSNATIRLNSVFEFRAQCIDIGGGAP
jgi:hypothetical protein